LSLIYGFHAVKAILSRKPECVKKLYILSERDDQRMRDCLALATQHHIQPKICNRRELDAMVAEAHQGIIIDCIPQAEYHEADLENLLEKLTEPAFLLVLDGVQDPHNLGACLRTAEAAGVHAVIAPKDRAASLTATARKVASGAAEIIPFVQVTNLARVLRSLKDYGIWLWGADEHAETSVFTADLSGPVALVLGAEGHGLRRLTKESCDNILRIPMRGVVSSLNVSVAVGVCLYEALRHRV
jgi:23S rRNA (guanosine2251-2'-O)-methyltransferase